MLCRRCATGLCARGEESRACLACSCLTVSLSHCLTAAKYCQLSICQRHHTSGLHGHGHGHGHGRDRHIYVLARALPRNHDTLRKTSCCEDRPGRAEAKEDKAALLACFSKSSKSYQFLLPVPRPTSQCCLCQLKSIKICHT